MHACMGMTLEVKCEGGQTSAYHTILTKEIKSTIPGNGLKESIEGKIIIFFFLADICKWREVSPMSGDRLLLFMS